MKQLTDPNSLASLVDLPQEAEPFDVRPLWASKAMLELGEIKSRRAFELYKHCVETGHWPGYCEDIEDLDPADWECKRYGIQP